MSNISSNSSVECFETLPDEKNASPRARNILYENIAWKRYIEKYPTEVFLSKQMLFIVYYLRKIAANCTLHIRQSVSLGKSRA